MEKDLLYNILPFCIVKVNRKTAFLCFYIISGIIILNVNIKI